MALGSTFTMPGADTTINDTAIVEVMDMESDTMSIDTEEGKLHGPQIARLIGYSTFGNNIIALLIKRFHIYRRDLFGFFFEILMPWILVIVGCALALLNYDKTQVMVTISPDAYPAP